MQWLFPVALVAPAAGWFIVDLNSYLSAPAGPVDSPPVETEKMIAALIAEGTISLVVVACGLGFFWLRHRTNNSWPHAMLALVASLALCSTPWMPVADSYELWPAGAALSAAVFAGLALSRAGTWPQDVMGSIVALILPIAVLLSPVMISETYGYEYFYLVPVLVAALSVGVVLRDQERQLAAERTAARDHERRLMAAELHDVIAHEVTGMVVLAQALQSTSTTPNPALARLEASGQRALEQIRSLVSTAKDGDVAAPRQATLADITAVVEEFSHTNKMAVSTRVDETLVLDPVIANAAHRVVSEALTNVRRHAATATEVLVEVKAHGDGLEVSVSDNGHGGGLGHGSGTGLTGLAERAALVGGRLSSGRVDGRWRVAAVLPRKTKHQPGD